MSGFVDSVDWMSVEVGGWGDNTDYSTEQEPAGTVENAQPYWRPDADKDPVDPVDDQVWVGDQPRRSPSGWMMNDLRLSSQLMNAAYTAAICGHKIRGQPVRRLNCHWHRPLDHDVKPHGYNKRGDLAPQPVHVKLDIYLDEDHFSARERQLTHSVLDKVWLLHSRSVRVDDALDHEFWFFSEPQRRELGRLMNEHMLDDLRLVLCALDPRKKVIYGRTRDSAPAPRVMRHVDYMSVSFGSDDEDSDNEHNGLRPIPYTLSGWEQHARLVHEEMRRVRKLEKQAVQYEDFANQAQIAVDERMKRLERANSLRDTLMRGIAAEREGLTLLESQASFAFSAHERRRAEEFQREHERQVTAENRPPTPEEPTLDV